MRSKIIRNDIQEVVEDIQYEIRGYRRNEIGKIYNENFLPMAAEYESICFDIKNMIRYEYNERLQLGF